MAQGNVLSGKFYYASGEKVFRAHAGLRDYRVHDPPWYFSGPVEVLMFTVPPSEYLSKLTKTAEVFRYAPTNGYCSAYDWAVAQHIFTSMYPKSPPRLYIIGNLWWRNLNF